MTDHNRDSASTRRSLILHGEPDRLAEAVPTLERGATGRPENLVPRDQPPYYCLALQIGGPHTTGRVERESCGRVRAALNGEPIPGLYRPGELVQAIGLPYAAAGSAIGCTRLRARRGGTLTGVIV